jgi:hypothetical protein
MTCPRCEKTDLRDARDLERHYVEDHLMGAAQAKKAIALNGHGGPPIPEIAVVTAEHVCPTCRTAIPCDWEAVAKLRHQAMLLRLLASKWEARKLGTLGKGSRANQDWTDAQARELVQSGMSLSAVGRLFGASHSTIRRAVGNGAAR